MAKVEAGTASHQELAILRNLLRDNGLTVGIQPEGVKQSSGPPQELPELPSPDYDD